MSRSEARLRTARRKNGGVTSVDFGQAGIAILFDELNQAFQRIDDEVLVGDIQGLLVGKSTHLQNCPRSMPTTSGQPREPTVMGHEAVNRRMQLVTRHQNPYTYQDERVSNETFL